MTDCYPISLVSRDLPCLVVGAGTIAERKVASLLEAGARVRVVAPKATAGLRELAASGRLDLIERHAGVSDLDDCRLIILATDDPRTNEVLAREAQRRHLLVNVVDVPELCNFLVPAIVKRGAVSVAITTEGTGPALAKRLRLLLERVVGEEYGHLAALMGDLRAEVKDRWATQPERAAAWERLLDGEVVRLLAEDRPAQARRLAREILGLQPEAER